MCSQWGDGNKPLPDNSGGGLFSLSTKRLGVEKSACTFCGRNQHDTHLKICTSGQFVHRNVPLHVNEVYQALPRALCCNPLHKYPWKICCNSMTIEGKEYIDPAYMFRYVTYGLLNTTGTQGSI